MPQERQVEGGISVMCYRMMPVSISATGSTCDDVPVTGTFFIESDCVEIPASLSFNAENSKSNIILGL